MKKLIFLLCAMLPTIAVCAQQTETTCSKSTTRSSDDSCDSATVCTPKTECIFNGEFENEENGFRIHLNLDNESIEIPGMSFLGATNGYLDGKTNYDLYGVWMVLNFELSSDRKKVKLRLTNDIGSDSQDVELSWIDENTLKYEALGKNRIMKVKGRKLIDTVPTMILKRKN